MKRQAEMYAFDLYVYVKSQSQNLNGACEYTPPIMKQILVHWAKPMIALGSFETDSLCLSFTLHEELLKYWFSQYGIQYLMLSFYTLHKHQQGLNVHVKFSYHLICGEI